MRNRKLIIEELSYFMQKGDVPSEAGIRCAELLERLVGLHHIDQRSLRKADWADPRFVQITLHAGSFSTIDFNDLTRLVFLAHDLCIRVEVVAASRGKLTLMMHPRHVREGDLSKRHPTIEAALASYRANNPEPGPLPEVGG